MTTSSASSTTSSTSCGTSSSMAQSYPRLVNVTAAAVAGGTAALLTHPMDVVRLRMQLNVSKATMKSSGTAELMHALSATPPRALFRGIGAAGVRESVWCSVRLGLYEPLRQGTVDALGREHLFASRMVAAVTSTLIGTVAAHPFDLLKVVYIATPVSTATYRVIATNLVGQRQVWRGLAPALQRAGLSGAVSIGTYDHVKSVLRDSTGLGATLGPFGLAVLASWVGSVATVAITAPLETVKVRAMASGMSTAALVGMAREHGVRTLWRGAGLMWFRVGPYTMVQLLVWEQCRAWMGLRPL
eukprot:PhM_4_TR6428/c0_g1_i1/m.86490